MVEKSGVGSCRCNKKEWFVLQDNRMLLQDGQSSGNGKYCRHGRRPDSSDRTSVHVHVARPPDPIFSNHGDGQI